MKYLSHSGEEIFDTMQSQGVFVLVSSRKIPKDHLLPLYYTKDRVEKIFELCKQDCKILPLNVETEATFRGHLMMTFMATVILKLISGKTKEPSPRPPLTDLPKFFSSSLAFFPPQ